MRAARWLVALAAAWAAEAAGHAALVASTPGDGAALAIPPAAVELRFSEPVVPLAVRLFAGAAAPIALPAPQGASELVRLALPAGLREGLYTLSFRVMSADSHPVGGSIVFAVGQSPPPRASMGSEASTLPAWDIALRAVRDLALLIAAGGALFVLCAGRFPAERAILGIAGALVVATAAAGIGLQGANMMASVAWSPEAWRAGLASSFGLSAAVAAAGALLIALAAMLYAGPARHALLLAGALAAIASLPLTGHAIAAQPRAAAVAALAAHGLGAAFWTGSLAALLAITRARASPVAAAPILRRFSRWAMAGVALLVIAGTVLALLQLGSVADLVGSLYGLLIAAKITLLLGLLLLAALNRFFWLPKLERGIPAAAVRLRGSIAGEAALVACVIGVTAVLVQTTPPRAFTQKIVHDGDAAEVSVTPARAGANAIVVRFHDRQGLAFDPDEVLLEIGNEAAGVEPAARALRRVGPGHYRREGSELAFPGLWTLDVQARIGGGDVASFRSQVPIR